MIERIGPEGLVIVGVMVFFVLLLVVVILGDRDGGI